MKRIILAGISLLFATSVFANDFAPRMEEYLEIHVADWAQSPVIISAIKAQNRRLTGISQDQILALDQAWRAEVGASESPTIDAVIQNPAADFLRENVAASEGVITEVFVMDANGLNVAASDVTSDMWQGDEAKFQMTFPFGEGTYHFGDVDFDESTQTYQAQISMALVDPVSGKVIGAITVGLNADSLL